MIYLDHAATTPMRSGVLEAMLPFYTNEFANASGAYAHGRKIRRAIECARGELASLIGADPREILYTSGGTEADNWALTGVVMANQARRRIVVSSIEHHAVLNTCRFLQSMGIEIIHLGVDAHGCIDPAAAESVIDNHTLLVSVMMANNETGMIEPVAQIAEIAHQKGALMHTDAVQAVGHIPVNVKEMGVDLLSLSAHKFGGPKGIGALYVRKGTRISPLIHGGAQEKGMRGGTENTAAIVGMGEAARLSSGHMNHEHSMIKGMRDEMMRLIRSSLPSVRINSDPEQCLPGHLHISIPDRDTSLLLARLDMEGICASAASACASGAMERSHVLTAMYPGESGYADLRFSLGAENTMDEINCAVRALAHIVNE